MESSFNYFSDRPERPGDSGYEQRQVELWQAAQVAPPELRDAYYAALSTTDRLAQRAEAEPAAVVGVDTEGEEITAADVYKDAIDNLRAFKAENEID